MSMASTVIASQQPEAALVVEEGTRARCCDHNDQVEPGQDSGGWVRALAVATFDVGTGHTLEQLFPGDSLDDSDRQRIRMLAMPDCNTTQIGDCFYCFRTRKSHRLPLMSSSLVDQHFEYCYAFFRQERNQECARGMFQKSVVLVSRYPYVNLFERLVKVIGPLYFSHGPAVLEAVFASVEEWPAPCPGSLCALPFLSETIMFQVPEIDMPPQVAAKYRWHRGVHLCSLWPRSRVRGLRRSLSGCGSADFQHSPSSRRASNNLTPPTDSGALRSESVGAGKQLDGDSGVATSTRATPDDGHSISGRDESPLRQAGDIDAGTGNEGGGVSSYGVVDGAGIEGRANNTLWSGTARSSGALVPPGLDEFQRLKRSSLGSGSLASVVCDSPSESWLATPKSGNTPLLALDGASGSNLAQSCYYVADRDSDEDDYSEEEEERRRLVNEIGWQGQQDDHSDEDEHDVEHDGRCPGEDGINVADDAGVGVSPSGDWREPRGDEQVPSESRAQEEDGDEEAPGNEREVSALQAAYSAAAEAAAVELRASQNGVDAPLNENGPSQVDAPQEAVAADRVCDVKASPLVENEKPSLSKPNDWRQRPTSLSPPRTSEMAFDRTKTYPNAGSQTPGPMSSSGRLVGLRAWADAAPESPWEAPPPIAADTAAKAKESKSKGRKAAPSPIVRAAYDGVKDPVTELEELLERRGRRSVRGRGDKSKGKGEVSPKGGKMAETAVESGVNAAGADAGALAPAMRDVSSEDTRGVVKVAEEVGVVPVAEEKERGAEEEKGSVGGDDAGEDTAEDVVAVEAGHANGNVHGVLQDQRTVAPEAVASPGESGVAAGGGRSSGVVGVRGEGGEEDASGRRLTRRSSSSSVRLSQDGRERGRDGRPPMPNKTNSHDKNIHRSASNLQGGRSPFAEMLLADEARFRAKQGLFQSIGLYSIFGKKLVEHLWLLWELVITASPTLVVGSSVGASSAAILGMVSLASPVYFCGDFRPHFTTFDPDYRDIVTAHDRVSKQQLWGSSVLGDANTGFPSMLLGVINPIFLRSLSRWPNAIVLPGAAGRSGGSNASAAAHRKMHKHPSASEDDPSPKNRSCPTANQVAEGLAAARPPPVRVQVVRSSTSLEHVIAADERPHEPIIVSRQQPVMVPDVSVLSRLLDPASPYNPTTAAAAAAAASTPVHGQPPTPIAGVVAAASAAAAAEAAGGPETKGQWRDSLRAINDIILRRHFADLTRSFLAPYTKYFRRSRPLQPLSVWQQRAVTRLSVYTEAEVLLPHFDEEEFLTLMFVAGPPKSFAHVQWETLYRRFMDSPNFRPWFNTQRSEAVERIREVSRAVCLRTTTQGMLDACAPGRLPQFLAKIKASIVREWKRKGQSVDWELLERMEMHQKGVEAAIAHQSHSAAASATGSIQP